MEDPKGYRFRPTDEELINHFLRLKVLGIDSQVIHQIAEVDFFKFPPWQLPGMSAIKSDDPYWYFFYKLESKYKNSNRVNRTTETGYWKITGQPRTVYTTVKSQEEEIEVEIGMKKSLTFYNGRFPSGIKTNWVIHEYSLTATNFPNNLKNYVVGCLKRKPDKKAADSSSNEEAAEKSSVEEAQ